MVKRSRTFKGGHSPSPWTPGEYKGVGTIAVAGDANYAKMPNVFPSNQVGGMRSKHKRSQRGGMGYGFANPEASYAAGSYFPVTPTCTSALDTSRGGNNFMSGGKGRSRSRSRSRTQKGGLIGGRRRRTSRRKGTQSKKWNQKGCNKKM